jgi:hypothetical protein
LLAPDRRLDSLSGDFADGSLVGEQFSPLSAELPLLVEKDMVDFLTPAFFLAAFSAAGLPSPVLPDMLGGDDLINGFII